MRDDRFLYDFLIKNLPYNPYSTDDLFWGIKPRRREKALQKRYIQLNTPHLRKFMIFDVDRPDALRAWYKAGLEAPTWTAINPENQHGHLVYVLETPVLTAEFGGRQAPLRYLAAIEKAYCNRLQADMGYNSLITKNPMHLDWQLQRAGNFWLEGDSLECLADCLKPQELNHARRIVGQTNFQALGLGRNCTAFNTLGRWAYRNIREYKTEANFEIWSNVVFHQCERLNAEFTHPMHRSEIRSIAHSVSKWVWYRFNITASDKRFSALQAHRNSLRKNKAGRKRIITEI